MYTWWRQLKDDFKYNLTLLDDRDHELSQFDRIYAELTRIARGKDEELSELKVRH